MHAKKATVIPAPMHRSYGNEEKCIIRKRQCKMNWKMQCAIPATPNSLGYTQIQYKQRE